MHVLIVVSHPCKDSLTHGVVARLVEGLQSRHGVTVEVADLAAEGFDPRFTARDVEIHLQTAPISSAIVKEQERIDRADAVMIVYPVYWWSLPALLKGWVDRVFCNGWAYHVDSASGLSKKLQHLKLHLLALGGADLGTYARHGYLDSMRTQIEHGIFDYCGAQVITSELLLPESKADRIGVLERARGLGERIASEGQDIASQASTACSTS